jgi:hypothetical protein
MPATLYDALGVPPSASDSDVRAALRRQIRKYYATTRNGHGGVEEALRFINHASRILTDPERRASYDHEIAVSSGSVSQRLAHVVNTAIAKTESLVSRNAPTRSIVRSRGGGQAADDAVRAVHHPGLTARIASLRRSPAIAASMFVLFCGLFVATVALVTPPEAIQVGKQVLLWVTLSLVGLAVIYGIVHAYAWRQRRRQRARPAQVEPAILNWRRDRSVFLGTDHPQEDASWIFQLRMAELERAKCGRTSEPRPWNRLAARIFDYAIWGLVLAMPLAELQVSGAISPALAGWLVHPLIAPIIVATTWIPVEALFVALMNTTPGKWLFGVYLQFSISDAYAVDTMRYRFVRALARSLRAWWMGVGGGVPLLAPVTVAMAYERLVEDQETSWDSIEDCLVTHVPAGNLNMVTGVVGLIAMLWVYGIAWHQMLSDSFDWARTAVESRVPASVPRALTEVRDNALRLGAQAVQDDRAGPKLARTPAPGEYASGGLPLDPELASLYVERKRRLAILSQEGPRMLEAGNWREASELCGTWASLDLDNARAWGCYGIALQAQGHHLDAVKALRKAKQYDPNNGSIDAAINRSQRGIIANFLAHRGL